MISVIMPTYNRAYVIDRAILSVLKQTYRDYELIIVDDGSDDNTSTKVQRFEDERIIYIKLENNRGASFARNVGIKKANGEYITFLDSDNEWRPNYLENRYKSIEINNSDFVFGPTILHKEEKTLLFPNKDLIVFLKENDKSKLLKQMI